jgi:hypothetical protein
MFRPITVAPMLESDSSIDRGALVDLAAFEPEPRCMASIPKRISSRSTRFETATAPGERCGAMRQSTS